MPEKGDKAVWNRSISENVKETKLALHTYPSSIVYVGNGLLFLCLLYSWYSFSWSLFFISLVLIIGLGFFFHYRNRRYIDQIKQFQDLVEHTSNPVQLIDGKGRIQYINSAFIQWSGMTKESLIGINLFDRMRMANHRDSQEGIWQDVLSEFSEGKTWQGEVEFIRPDNQIAISSLIFSPIFNSRGKLVECIVCHDDLTERKEFTRKIFETQRQYRGIVEHSLEGIMVIQDERIVYVNPSVIRIFGYTSAEEMNDLKIIEIIAPQSRNFLLETLQGHLNGEEILKNHEVRGLTKQAKMIDLEANGLVIEWNQRSAVQMSFRDITERKMLEREQALWLWEQETLSDIDRKLVGIFDLEKIFAAILQQTLNLTRTHFAGVLLCDETQTTVQWRAIRGNTLQHKLEENYSDEIFGNIFNENEPHVFHESAGDKKFQLSKIPIIGEENLISTAWIPLIVEGKHKGKLVVGYRHFHDFNGREMRLFTSLAEKHSIAMVNTQLYADLVQRERDGNSLRRTRSSTGRRTKTYCS